MTFTKSPRASPHVAEQRGGDGGVGLEVMAGHGIEEPLAVLLVERLEIDHLEVDTLGEVAARVVDVGDPPRHPGPEVPPRRPEHHDPAPGHVLAPVVPHPFHHRRGPRVAHAEALPHLAAHVALAAGGPVEDDVAGDDLLLGGEGRRLVGAQHHATARQSLGQVVVGVPDEPQRHAPRDEGAEALPRRAPEGEGDGVVGQARAPVLGRDLVAEQGPHRAVDVGDGQLQRHRASRGRWRGGTRRGNGGPAPGRGRGPGPGSSDGRWAVPPRAAPGWGTGRGPWP